MRAGAELPRFVGAPSTTRQTKSIGLVSGPLLKLPKGLWELRRSVPVLRARDHLHDQLVASTCRCCLPTAPASAIRGRLGHADADALLSRAGRRCPTPSRTVVRSRQSAHRSASA
jgi:hypothetical protein